MVRVLVSESLNYANRYYIYRRLGQEITVDVIDGKYLEPNTTLYTIEKNYFRKNILKFLKK